MFLQPLHAVLVHFSQMQLHLLHGVRFDLLVVTLLRMISSKPYRALNGLHCKFVDCLDMGHFGLHDEGK